MLKVRKIWEDISGSMSLEFALVTTLFLVPLILFGFDTLFIMMGYEQIGQVTHSVIMYAWSFPSDATNQQDINQVIAASIQNPIGSVALANAPYETFGCLQSDGSTTSAASDGTCTTGQSETRVSYEIVSIVQLPINLGLIQNPYQMTSNVIVRIK